jgi:hypothetical protein
MPEINTELLIKVYQHIQRNPDKYDQGVWAAMAECGTVACFAGWTVLLNGDQPFWAWGVPDSNGKRWASANVMSDGTFIFDYAETLLGLSTLQTHALFRSSSSLNDIRRHIIDLTGVDPHLSEITDA